MSWTDQMVIAGHWYQMDDNIINSAISHSQTNNLELKMNASSALKKKNLNLYPIFLSAGWLSWSKWSADKSNPLDWWCICFCYNLHRLVDHSNFLEEQANQSIYLQNWFFVLHPICFNLWYNRFGLHGHRQISYSNTIIIQIQIELNRFCLFLSVLQESCCVSFESFAFA